MHVLWPQEGCTEVVIRDVCCHEVGVDSEGAVEECTDYF
jgi:hypothetical protein